MDLLTLSEAAPVANVSIQTLRNYMRDKRLTAYRKAGRAAVDRGELMAVFGPTRITAYRAQGEARIIAIANQKGGTGKTTTATNVGYLLGLQHRTLLVDADAQANLTMSFGVEPDKLERTLFNVLNPDQALPLEQAVVQIGPPPPALYLVGANIDLAVVTRLIIGKADWALYLREALSAVKSRYDFIVIDCPPSLDGLTINALTAATEIIVPVEMSYYGLRGISRLIEVVREARRLNPTLADPRYLAVRTDNTKLTEGVVDEMRRAFGDRVYKTQIRRYVAVGEAQMQKQPIHVFKRTSPVAKDFEQLTEEILHG